MTNLTALLSGVMFWKFAKGSVVSVVGMFAYLLNFINMIVLLSYCLSTFQSDYCKLAETI